jgi:hypothetical protein
LAVTAGAAIVVAGLGIAAYVAAEGHPNRTGSGASAAHHGHHGASTTTTTTTTTVPPSTTTTSPGTLPQTDVLPPATSPQLDATVTGLWHAVVDNDVTLALPGFFPESAYVKLKSLADAASDYQYRLVGELRADVRAAHALLGSDASSAVLVGLQVPEQYAHWVPPGTCYNSIGYYEVPNSRLVYRVNGALRSFGVASMISWRGVWYVVHLGGVTRPTDTTNGMVDAPATGPGYSAYSSTC